MVTCTRASFLLSIVVFWAVLTIFHFASPGDIPDFASFFSLSGHHSFELYSSQASTSSQQLIKDAAVSSTLIRRSLLTSFKSAHSVPKLPCNFSTSNPEQLYTFRATAEDKPDLGTGVSVTISMTCTPPSSTPSSSSLLSPRAAFRIHVTSGPSMAALPPTTVLQANTQSLSAFLRVPDVGDGYQLHVKLMLYNASDELTVKDYPLNYQVKDEEVFSRWIDKPIIPSPYNFSIPTSSHYKPTPYSSLLSPPSSSFPTSRPLCFSSSTVNATLAGRWQLGPRHEHIKRQWESDSIFDDFNALWSPYDCELDYTISLLDALQSLKWLNIIGDSNMRALFTQLCEVSGGQRFDGDSKIGYMDLPKFCAIKNGEIVITYSSWFQAKVLPLHPYLSFNEQCTKYSEDLEQIKKDDTIFGWPNCTLASSTIKQRERPSLLYLGWGSHVAEWGASAHTENYFRTELMSLPYFTLVPTIFALTEEVDVSMIPSKFGKQFVYRNNERIWAVNQIIIKIVTEKRNSGLWPVDMIDSDGKEVKGFLPIFDVFSATHAASEVLHGDAVHFWGEFEVEIAKWLSHWIMHAPQLNTQYKRISAKEKPGSNSS